MGLFEHANGGIIFLDEIGDMPLSTQAKLLRTLQHQEVLRVGSLTPRKVDVRVIAATHRDLRQAIADKQFREDLYYRLTMVEIRVPRLAERRQDLPLLVRAFIERFSQQYSKPIRSLTQRAQLALARHDWPGNVRELENVIGHAAMMVMGEMIDIADLPEYLSQRTDADYAAAAPEQALPAVGTTDAASDALSPLEEQERVLLVRALEQAAGNQSQAARILRIGRDALRYKMKKHNLV